MRNLIIFIAFSFSYLFGIDCNSMSSVSTFNGHYYAKTNTRTTYDTIRVSAVNDKAYLAIPNSAEENEFIKSLVGGNTEAWIGVFDPNHAKNYCFDNGTCFFDDGRFRDVKGQALTYKNWASYEPNNFVESSDMENNLAVVDPLGENWVIMNGNTGQWYDVGNHKNSNQNPRKHVAIVEFDEKPICLNESDGVTDTDFPERVCNTQVFDDNIANAHKGTTAKCLFDINGKEYCPQALADAAKYWSYIAGESIKNVNIVMDYAQGEYKEYSSKVRDFMDGFASVHNSTVTDYQSGSGVQNVGTVEDYQNGSSLKRSNTVIDYVNKSISNNDVVLGSANFNYSANFCTDHFTKIILVPDGYSLHFILVSQSPDGNTDGRCGYSDYSSSWLQNKGVSGWNIPSAFKRINVITFSKPIYSVEGFSFSYSSSGQGCSTVSGSGTGNTSRSSSDANAYGYAFDNQSLTNCGARSAQNPLVNISFNSIYTRSLDCPSDYTNNGEGCQKTISFDFYQYTCPVGYTPINYGLSSFSKIDPNTSSVNWVTLDDDVNSSVPPSANCKKTITYSYYKYNCPIGYTINDGGLTSLCPRVDPNNTTNDEGTLSLPCNNATPPAGNCTKIIPYTYYSYECNSGYTAIDKGLSSCNKTDSSNTSDSSSSLSLSCNSETPPKANCYKDISYNYYTYSCPSGYSIENYGLTSCDKTDPNTSINNEESLNDSCNNATPPAGNCSKGIEYAYYSYVCTSATNEFGEAYSPINSGLSTCSKKDNDLISTNPDLASSCNSEISPVNNCKTTSYTCNSEIREPAWIDNKWQCSPYPCYGNNNMEDLSQNVGTKDKDDDGWTQDGNCSGTIYIFNGNAKQCRSSDKFFGLTGGGCCKDDKTAMGLLSCNAEEKELRLKKESKKCHYVGEYCSKKISLGFSKICVRTSKSYCCFNSTLGRIIAEQGSAQLTDIDWGVASNPNCRGFTVEEFQRLDLSQMDLTEFTNSIKLPNVENKQTEIIEKINNHLNLIK